MIHVLFGYSGKVQQTLPPDPVTNVMVDLSTGRDNIKFTSENEINFSDNVLTYLEILRRYSNIDNVSSHASISYQLLQVLKYISFSFPDSNEILVGCGNIIANLAVNDFNCKAIIESDILSLLMKWKRSPFVSLQITSSRILNNLDMYTNNVLHLRDGIYVLHPENRCEKPADIDIVFIHGIKGSPFYTWRQNDSIKNSYTYCWPKDWLSVDYPNSRVISVEYKSTLSDWLLSCPLSKDEYSLDRQAENIRKKLKECGIGERPIIWVTHLDGWTTCQKNSCRF